MIFILTPVWKRGTKFISLQLLREFKKPSPMREVSLVVHRDFVKKKLVEIFREEIVASIPEGIKKNRGEIVPVK